MRWTWGLRDEGCSAAAGVAAGTVRRRAASVERVHRPVAEDALRRDVVRALQERDETGDGLQLLGGGPGDIEVADEADSDAVVVVLVVRRLGVSAPLLLAPARADFHLPVTRVAAVADDEVVA